MLPPFPIAKFFYQFSTIPYPPLHSVTSQTPDGLMSQGFKQIIVYAIRIKDLGHLLEQLRSKVSIIPEVHIARSPAWRLLLIGRPPWSSAIVPWDPGHFANIIAATKSPIRNEVGNYHPELFTEDE